jgi:hypothetical protein
MKHTILLGLLSFVPACPVALEPPRTSAAAPVAAEYPAGSAARLETEVAVVQNAPQPAAATTQRWRAPTPPPVFEPSFKPCGMLPPEAFCAGLDCPRFRCRDGEWVRVEPRRRRPR